MKRRWLVAIEALVTAMALSATGVAAAPSVQPVRAITNVDACDEQGHGSGDHAVKPAKADKQRGQGRRLGHDKQKQTHAPGVEHERKHNHGWFVSQAARNTSLSGGNHGKVVSEAARSARGKPANSEP